MRDLVDVDNINDGRDGRIGDAPGDRGERRRRVWVPRAATGRGDDAGSAWPALEEPAPRTSSSRRTALNNASWVTSTPGRPR